jgi:hypothetical protein
MRRLETLEDAEAIVTYEVDTEKLGRGEGDLLS